MGSPAEQLGGTPRGGRRRNTDMPYGRWPSPTNGAVARQRTRGRRPVRAQRGRCHRKPPRLALRLAQGPRRPLHLPGCQHQANRTQGDQRRPRAHT